MAESKPTLGQVGWIDLTVDDAPAIRDFYCQIAGWQWTPVAMDGYEDFCVGPDRESPVAGICHRRGLNAGVPPQWLIYISVADLDRSQSECLRLGGRIIGPPREMGAYGTLCIVEDPAGAVVALIQPLSQAKS